jgi:hypothetical protein
MTTNVDAQNSTSPMTIGLPGGADVEVTVSQEVERLLDTSTVSFDGVVIPTGWAYGAHWLTQASADEVIIAAQAATGGGLLAAVYLIERSDEQDRRWFCVTSSRRTAGLFLDRTEALDFAVEVAIVETPVEGWDFAADRRVPASVHVRVTTDDLV